LCVIRKAAEQIKIGKGGNIYEKRNGNAMMTPSPLSPSFPVAGPLEINI